MVRNADQQEAFWRHIAGKPGAYGQRHFVPKAVADRLSLEIEGVPDVWVVCFSSSGKEVGEQVIPPEGVSTQKIGGNIYKLYAKAGGCGGCSGCPGALCWPQDQDRG